MRSHWPILMLLCVLASLLVPGIASASTASGAETRVWAFNLVDGVRVGVERSLTLELHRGCEIAYDRLASDSLLAARGGAHWGNPKTLARHFRDHGADFGAKNADDYARQASDFLRSSQAGGLPTKIDADGVIRVFDPKSNTFGAFNPDGTTRTFFKPSSPTYWDRQPGSAPWTPK
jgi:hypothetical protein